MTVLLGVGAVPVCLHCWRWRGLWLWLVLKRVGEKKDRMGVRPKYMPGSSRKWEGNFGYKIA